MPEGLRWIELSEGDEFAGYRIEQTLGRGGMGVLYLAVEPGLERRVALKLIAPEAATEEVFARRFAEESRIAASIEHPNVVPIYAAGEEDGVPYIAMRYVSGADLGARIRREGRLGPAVATALIAQVGAGLDAIHAAGLVHRDVKPANVLLSGAGGDDHAYITDFGVARNVATESGLTQTGRFVGTLDYVAPEQISGGEVDARADIYALGCLLFKLLTGDVPFPRETEAARLYAHLNEPPPAPSLHAADVPMALDDVVIRAMSKQPGDRHPSAGDLGRAALAALSGERTTVPEHTVATGAAATRESVAPEPPTVPVPSRGATVASSEAETVPGPGGSQPSEPSPGRARRRRRLALVVGLVAIAAIAIGAIVLGGGDGDSGPEASAGNGSQAGAGGGVEGSGGKAETGPEPLKRSELIAAADRICERSQSSYKAAREEARRTDPAIAREEVPDVPFSEQLVNISTPAVRDFRQLVPPPAVESDYEAYVASQEEVKGWDEDALRAAQAGDTAAYLKAREERDDTGGDRRALAEAIGLRECSGSEL